MDPTYETMYDIMSTVTLLTNAQWMTYVNVLYLHMEVVPVNELIADYAIGDMASIRDFVASLYNGKYPQSPLSPRYQSVIGTRGSRLCSPAFTQRPNGPLESPGWSPRRSEVIMYRDMQYYVNPSYDSIEQASYEWLKPGTILTRYPVNGPESFIRPYKKIVHHEMIVSINLSNPHQIQVALLQRKPKKVSFHEDDDTVIYDCPCSIHDTIAESEPLRLSSIHSIYNRLSVSYETWNVDTLKTFHLFVGCWFQQK